MRTTTPAWPAAELRARRARPGETLTTLDGKVRELDPSMLVIADADGPSGIAGIMGGADSEIGDDTTIVVLEAANFTRAQVMRTSRKLGLRTEGSNRWEKGVDPYLAPVASRAAARLLLEVAGGKLAPDPIDVCARLPERAQLHLRLDQVPRITAVDVPRDDAVRILDGLGFEPRPAGDGIDVRVPTWRWLDVTREIDLVEEVIRIYGLERVPSTLPSGARTGGLNRGQRLRRLLADAACGAGLDEAQTVALVAEDWADRLGLAPDDPRRRAVEITNPLSSEHARMRPLLLTGLLEAVARNVALGRDDVALFELAHVFHHREDGPLADEPWTLGALLHGHLGGTGWRGAGVPASFFAARGVLDAVLGAVGLEVDRRAWGRRRRLPPSRPRRPGAGERGGRGLDRRAPSHAGGAPAPGRDGGLRDRRRRPRGTAARAAGGQAGARPAAAAAGHRGGGGRRAPRSGDRRRGPRGRRGAARGRRSSSTSTATRRCSARDGGPWPCA